MVIASGALVGAMTSMTIAKLSRTLGSCPVCGREVARLHSFDGARLTDRYGCFRCGPTVYRASA